MKILIADDIEENRYLLQILFQTSGYEVISASNGQSALDLLAKQNFDLIISDVFMPVLDGFHLCHDVKENPLL